MSMFSSENDQDIQDGCVAAIQVTSTMGTESASLEFKREFNPLALGEWCELIKDIVAIANSDGGEIVIGANDDGTLSGRDISAARALDAAEIVDKIRKYTNENFGDLRVVRDRADIVSITIGAALDPLVFTNAGTYPNPITPKKQKTAFGVGTAYFRHGAKSEPGTTQDLREFIQRRLDRVRHNWFEGIRSVVSAPEGSTIQVVSPGKVVVEDRLDAAAVRITNDESAVQVRIANPDETHPWRQKELVAEIKQRLNGKRRITSYDIQAVRLTYDIANRSDFSIKLNFETARYSRHLADWIVSEFEKDSEFFEKARVEYKKCQRLRKPKPR